VYCEKDVSELMKKAANIINIKGHFVGQNEKKMLYAPVDIEVWYGMVWYDMVWYGVVWCGMVWLWYGMVWYGMVWYGTVWYGMVQYHNHFGVVMVCNTKVHRGKDNRLYVLDTGMHACYVMSYYLF